ncbi:MAG: DUF4159 domain-containing protein [Phycisphaerae bacterium]
MAILRAVDRFKRDRKTDGTWPDYARQGGVTALACYALLQAGVAPDDEAVAQGLATLHRVPNEATYVVALKAMAFAAADPKRYREDLQACVDWLVEIQHATGAWGYGLVPESEMAGAVLARGLRKVQNETQLRRAYERADASNTQFAILGLAEAERAGAHVPIEVWRRADRHLRVTQLPGGGWGYVYRDPDPNEAYGSMTAAALASLYLCAERLAPQESADDAGQRSAAIEQGLQWIAEHYSLDENPNRGAAWYYFWLYSLERAGVTSGRRTFGPHDWFREGTALLVKGQRADGSWSNHLYQDALALLFLAKGFKPLLVQRLEWQGAWRRDPRDLEHLVRFLETRVGGQAVAWQTLSPESPIEDWLAAPILHVTGRGPLRMLAASVLKLREYVEQGGLILFDAEGADAAFTESVRQLLPDLFPGAAFEPLPANHPVYRAVYPVPPVGLETLRVGCRASVILAPQGLADAWAAADPGAPGPNDILRLGENLAVYATGNEALPDRLAEATVLEMPAEETPPPNVLRIGQIQHDGDWQPRPLALPKLLENLPREFGVSVWSRPVPIRLTEADPGRFPVLYLVGHYTFTLSDKERAALKDYLDRGGFLWAEACCGRDAFDKAFRSLVADLFPDSPLEELPADHPIYSGQVGTKIDRVAYSPAAKADAPNLDRPVLLGLKRNGHLVVVYSPYGIGAGLDGIRTYGARALEPDDAKRLATNILLYGLSN